MLYSNSELEISDLSFSFQERTLWKDLMCTVEPGSFVALTGESGSGKTTLLQCLGSLEKPTGGRITWGSAEITALKGKAQRTFLRESVSFAFQNSGLVTSWTVRKNLEIGGFSVKDRAAEVNQACERFKVNTKMLDAPAYRLSGGEQQRVGLLRVALRKTPLVLLDEPTAALDDHNAHRVLTFIQDHCAEGGTAVVATHDSRLIQHVTAEIHL